MKQNIFMELLVHALPSEIKINTIQRGECQGRARVKKYQEQ